MTHAIAEDSIEHVACGIEAPPAGALHLDLLSSATMQKASFSELNDAFVNISFEEVSNKQPEEQRSAGHGSKDQDALYAEWKDENSNPATDPGFAFTNILRGRYPGHSVVRVTNPYLFPLLGFPDLLAQPLPNATMDSVVSAFMPFARRSGRVGGIIGESVWCGGFAAAWKKFDFMVFEARYPFGMFADQNLWVVHDGPEAPIYELLVAVGSWSQEPHGEVLVYDQGYWQKDRALYEEIQKAEWKDVILKDKFKVSIQSSIKDFFKTEAVYKELGVPWKRGLIFYGPAGNGKTISLKAAMHDTDNPILYVRTLTNYRGDEAAMADIFSMARRLSPCILVLEDIDSHINERNRSFFLNQLDGLDNNDGLLLIATTNHLERLDNSVSNRPSRFDRKYLFDDPDEEERRLYCGYWQKKLANNKKVSFPNDLADDIAKMSHGLSFAYLKEAFVSTLVLLATNSDLDFAEALKAQVKELVDQVPDHPENVLEMNMSSKGASCAATSELAATRELLLKMTGGQGQKSQGLTTMGIMPPQTMRLRQWI